MPDQPVLHARQHHPQGPDPIPSLAMWPIKVTPDAVPVSTGDGRFIWLIPEDLDAHSLAKVEAFITTPGTGATTINMRLLQNGVTDLGDMLTTAITIDSGERNSKDATVQPVVDVTNALVAHGDHISFDVDAAADGSSGLGVYCYFLAEVDAVASITGPAGADGVGVPSGGADGYVLAKASAADFDTAWVSPGGAPNAADVPIADAGNYYTGTDVEAALQELGAAADESLTYQDHSNTGASETVDASAADVHRLVLDSATVTLTLTGAPAAGTPGLIRLQLVQDATGGRLVSWPGSVIWAGDGSAPTLQTAGDAVDVVDLETEDGGTTWLGIHAPQTGATGAAGADGADGADGVGVPAGGTTGQVLAKASNTDYDTEWIDETGGGGGGGLLAIQVYAPSSQTVYTRQNATLADVDATNAAVTFTAPASGNVLVRVSAWLDYTGTGNEGYLGLREGSSDISGTITRVLRGNTDNDLEFYASVPMYVTGLSAGSHTLKLSFAINQTGATPTMRIIIQDGSGPSTPTKWGPLVMEVWEAP